MEIMENTPLFPLNTPLMENTPLFFEKKKSNLMA